MKAHDCTNVVLGTCHVDLGERIDILLTNYLGPTHAHAHIRLVSSKGPSMMAAQPTFECTVLGVVPQKLIEELVLDHLARLAHLHVGRLAQVLNLTKQELSNLGDDLDAQLLELGRDQLARTGSLGLVLVNELDLGVKLASILGVLLVDLSTKQSTVGSIGTVVNNHAFIYAQSSSYQKVLQSRIDERTR